MPRGIYKRNRKGGTRGSVRTQSQGALALAPQPQGPKLVAVMVTADVAELLTGMTPDAVRRVFLSAARQGLAKL